jgi:hypothetical protein
MDERRTSASMARKTEDSCRRDASIHKSIRGVVSSADWYATCNQIERHSTQDRTGAPWNRIKSLWVSMTRRPNAIVRLASSIEHRKQRSSAHQLMALKRMPMQRGDRHAYQSVSPIGFVSGIQPPRLLRNRLRWLFPRSESHPTDRTSPPG